MLVILGVMKKIILLWLFCCLNITVAMAAQTQVKSLRVRATDNNARLVFDVSAIPEYQIFQLKNPARLVIDFSNTYLTKKLLLPTKKPDLLVRLRAAKRNKHDLRIVIDLKKNSSPKSFTLKANKTYGPRLVIDLALTNKKNSRQKVAKKHVTVTKSKAARPKIKPFIVAIDAGHGGKDPGAHGRHGTLEKRVVFQIAQKLARLVNKQSGMKSVLVRKGDYYVSLRERMNIARKANADLFISIHADAFNKPKASGASVYTLSRRGATSEAARWLANNENSVDLVGGVSLDDKDDLLASVLLDLSQTASQDISQVIAKEVLSNFSRIGKLHSHKVQKAGFVVLKSPDIPSILIETAFISNPKEERRLKSPAYQYKMASAIHKGIVSYAKKHQVAYNASKRVYHTISRGETLLGIALKYGITLDQIKRANTVTSSNRIKIGQVLAIPVKS